MDTVEQENLASVASHEKAPEISMLEVKEVAQQKEVPVTFEQTKEALDTQVGEKNGRIKKFRR